MKLLTLLLSFLILVSCEKVNKKTTEVLSENTFSSEAVFDSNSWMKENIESDGDFEDQGISFNRESSIKIKSSVEDISNLKNFPDTTSLSLANSNVSDIDVIKDLKNLQVLVITGSRVNEESLKILDQITESSIMVIYSSKEVKFESSFHKLIDVESPCEQLRMNAYEKKQIKQEDLMFSRAHDLFPLISEGVDVGTSFCKYYF